MIARTSIAVLAAATLAAAAWPALALDGVKTGSAAFGGWRHDAPGVQRLIGAGDIAAAGAETRSFGNSPQTVAQPDGALPQVKDGFAIERVMAGLGSPRTLLFAPNGDLFVANSYAGEIVALRFADGQVAPAEGRIFAGDLDQPYGLAFYPPENPRWLYAATTTGLIRYPYAGGLTAEGRGEVLFNDMPDGGHWTRSIAFSGDGTTLYYSVGSQSNVAEGMGETPPGGLAAWQANEALGAAWGGETGRALVYAMDPDGSNRRVLATGLRNCSGLAVQPATEAVWCAVNERDALGNDIPFDYVTSVSDGAFYGWPWFYIGANPDPRHHGARGDLAGAVTVPDVLLQSHSAPLNLTFYDSAAWGEDYRGDAFVALHGSWNRDPRTGYKLVRLFFEDGEPTGIYEDFVTGFVLNDSAVWGRPVGVAVSPAGDLYFSEDGNGTLWRVTRTTE